jgi:hypothetical protein
VLAIESSETAAAAARRRLAGDARFPRSAWSVLRAHVGDATPEAAAAAAAAAAHRPQLIFGEVLGFLAGSEGVARAAAALQEALAAAGAPAPAWAPCAVATFFAPTLLSLDALQGAVPPGNTCLLRMAPVPGAGGAAWLLADAVPLAAAVAAAGLAPPAGVVEALAVSRPLAAQLQQAHATVFVARGPGVVHINALAAWMWAGLPAGRPQRARQPGRRTAFPYGAPGLPPDFDAGVGVDFSSADSDRAAGACAKNWRNLVVLLGQRVALEPGSVLTVTWTADLAGDAPAYSVSAQWAGGGVTAALGDLYPDWVQMDAAGESAARALLLAPPTPPA